METPAVDQTGQLGLLVVVEVEVVEVVVVVEQPVHYSLLASFFFCRPLLPPFLQSNLKDGFKQYVVPGHVTHPVQA